IRLTRNACSVWRLHSLAISFARTASFNSSLNCRVSPPKRMIPWPTPSGHVCITRCGFQALGDSGLQAAAQELWTLYTLGMAAYEQADWARAQAFHSRRVEQATVLGSGNHLTSLALYGLGRVAHQQGDYARACTLLEEALVTQRAVDDPVKAALTLVGLGQVLL